MFFIHISEVIRMKSNTNWATRLLFICKWFFFLFLITTIIYLVIGQIILPDERDSIETHIVEVYDGWNQVLEDGSLYPVTTPGKANANLGDTIVIQRTLSQEDCQYPFLCFYAQWRDCSIYLDDNLELEYTTKDSRLFGLNSPSRFLFLSISPEDAGKTISIKSTSTSRSYRSIGAAYFCDLTGFWSLICEKHGIQTLLELLLLLFSIIVIIMCTSFKIVYKRSISLIYVGFVSLLCAIWLLSEVLFRQLIFKNLSTLAPLPFICLLLVPFPTMIYMNETQKRRYEKKYSVGLLYSAIITVTLTFMQICNIADYQKNISVIHTGILFTAYLMVSTVIKDFKRGYTKEYILTIIGFSCILSSAIIELVAYYINPRFRLGFFIVCGLIGLMTTASINAGREIVHTQKEKQQAIEANEAKARFLANMSHEIRTPINTIIGMNEMILRENVDPDITEYANNIQNSSKTLLGLVNDILDFSKIESGQLDLMEGSYHITSIINDEVQSITARLGSKDIELKLEIDESLPCELWGDELRIKQILTNLLTNALKYTEKGIIYLTVKSRPIDNDNIILTFMVEDTGIGIKEDDLQKLFDSFTRLEENRNRNIEGTGLGLNIVKLLVDLMKGEISVSSVYGEGSIFTVSIPQKIVNSEPIRNIHHAINLFKSSQEPKQEESFIAASARILVVDDNEMNLAVIKGLLKRTKVQLDLATSGNECLEKTKYKRYDLILMDHMMPILDGIETLHLMRTDPSNPNQKCPVIALTANAIAGCREMYLQFGFDDYLSKPVEHWKLEQIVVKYLPKELVLVGTLEDDLQPANNTISMDTINSDLDFLSGNKAKPIDVKGEQSMRTFDESYTNVIDHDLGVSYCGESEELYIEILQSYYDQASQFKENLKKFYDSEDWENYAIVAHAMKSCSKNIGAMNFSEQALLHETAAKDENDDVITADFDSFYANYESLLKIVEGML